MWFMFFLTSDPREVDLIQSCRSNLLIKPVGNVVFKIMCVLMYQKPQYRLLCIVERTDRDSIVFCNSLITARVGNNITGDLMIQYCYISLILGERIKQHKSIIFFFAKHPPAGIFSGGYFGWVTAKK